MSNQVLFVGMVPPGGVNMTMHDNAN